tara:strand:+ start:62 stop:988 length:927 start_codon:yes stop_codon:yes gene_type:complete
MIKTLLIFLILCITSIAHAEMPWNQYFPPGPNIQNLYTFSEEESIIFRNNNITSIEIKQGQGSKTIYNINKKGLAINWTEKSSEKNIEIDECTGVIKYNNNCQVILSRFECEDKYLYYDSITYNTNGKLMNYYYHGRYISHSLRKWKKPKENNYFNNFNFRSSNKNGTILCDSTLGNEVCNTYNNQNILMKSERFNRIDSLSIDSIIDGFILKKYWYKMGNSPVMLGMTEKYKSGLMLSKKVFAMGNENVVLQETHYSYNNSKQLIRTNNKMGETIREYIYNELGLVEKIIEPTKGDEHITTYKYLTN